MKLDLSEDQVKHLLEILTAAEKATSGNDTPSAPVPHPKGEKYQGIRGRIKIVGQAICPELCMRFQETGTCVHMDKREKIAPAYTNEFERMRCEKKAKVVQRHKDNEKPAEWAWVQREEWQDLPWTYGVYVWVDEWDKLVFCGKASDLRRRHYAWANMYKGDKRWVATNKIWYLHTGWYGEIVELLEVLPRDTEIDKKMLVAIYKTAKPLVLPEAPEFGR